MLVSLFIFLSYHNLKLFMISGICLAMTYERSQAVSLSFPITTVYTILAIKTPEDAVSFMAYLDPMTPLTWMTVGIVCLVCPLFLTLATRYFQLLASHSN